MQRTNFAFSIPTLSIFVLFVYYWKSLSDIAGVAELIDERDKNSHLIKEDCRTKVIDKIRWKTMRRLLLHYN